MSDAYVCDRCGALGKGTPAARVASTLDDTGGTITEDTITVSRGPTDRSPGAGLSSPGQPPAKSVTTTHVEKADLCGDCAAAFADWWAAGKEGER